jgi:hypothetical protein
MTRSLGTYSFLPWLRQGVARTISAADDAHEVATRASIHVALSLHGEPVAGAIPDEPIARDVELFGPGDVIGIDRRAIVRTEPRDWITNFEPNYLPQIEFYDEDFPWRYTPAAPDATRLRLRPWIALVVLSEDEFKDGTNLSGRPLPYIDVADASVFPPADQLWAWAHVHVNRTLAGNDAEFVSTDMNAVLPRLQAVLAENPDLAYSRLVCPRKLDENTAYHAFVVPVFETGRLAGLKEDPVHAPYATFSAWGTYPGKKAATSYPVYHRWYFRTSTQGDFEYLVRLLQPRPVDHRVGRRDMDVLDPGANLPPISDPDLHGILRLGGALRVPPISLSDVERAEAERYEHWAEPYPRPFQEALAAFVDLADAYSTQPAATANASSGLSADPDPLVVPPLYLRWHALTTRVLRERQGTLVQFSDDWRHELNLDPRHRVAAGFGTRVIQKNQEDYVNAAWEQIGDVLEANRRIRAAQLAREVSWIWYDRHLRPLQAADSERAFSLLAPVQRRVVSEGLTIHYQRTESLVQPVLTSVALRRVTRPGTVLMRSLPAAGSSVGASARGVGAGNLLARVNAGEVSAAPPKLPPDVPTVEDLGDHLLPAGVPRPLVDALRRLPWLPYALIAAAALVAILLLLLLPLGLGIGIAVALVAAAAAGALWLLRLLRRIRQADVLQEGNLTPEAVDALPASPDFVLSQPGAGFNPRLDGADSAEAGRFKTALKDWHMLARATAEVSTRPAPRVLDLPGLTTAAVRAIDPLETIPRRTLHAIDLPPRIRGALDDSFQEVMAYPVFDLPMYKPLADISAELFLPNVNLVEPNSITLLETNRKFIEAYVAGLNHEFARELLWREYVTDQRGSYFRQFWDVRSRFTGGGPPSDALKESLRDVAELHRWRRGTELGAHEPNQPPGAREEKVVLVIRGELLKKYPTAVIYAHRADWHMEHGVIDPAQERVLAPLSDAEEANPPLSKVRTPLYEAKVEPDIYFFGFDLTAVEAMGGTGEQSTDPPGWFFVIKERPGEPRFGFDLARDQAAPIETFNDLAWADALPGGQPGDFVQAGSLAAIVLADPGLGEDEKQEQHHDDVSANAAAPSAARWATLLYQAPAMVAVHAAEMLRPR